MSAKSRDEKRQESTSSSAASDVKAPAAHALKAQHGSDVAIVCGVSDDGQGVDIIRKRGERIEAGTVRRLEQGKPIHGEVVRLRPRENFPMVCDVEVEMPARQARETTGVSSGPAQVATETYRKNWDAIYGRSKKPDSLLN